MPRRVSANSAAVPLRVCGPASNGGRPTYSQGAFIPISIGAAAELAEILRGIKALGVQHCGVRFRSRSADELIEQIEAFGHDVAPLING